VKLLYDIYHMQIMEGDIIRTIQENIKLHLVIFTLAAFLAVMNSMAHRNSIGARSRRPLPILKFDGFFAHEFVPAFQNADQVAGRLRSNCCDV